MPDKTIPRMDEKWCGEDIRCKESHALFSIRSNVLDPAAISAGLGITPSEAWVKDEERRRPWGMWHLSTEGLVASRSPEQQALYLLERLEPKADFLRRFVKDPEYLVLVSFWWESWNHIGGFELSSGTVSRLAAISNYVGFRVIGSCEDEAGSLGVSVP